VRAQRLVTADTLYCSEAALAGALRACAHANRASCASPLFLDVSELAGELPADAPLGSLRESDTLAMVALAMALAASCMHPLHDQHQLTACNENKHILMGDGLTVTTLSSMHRGRNAANQLQCLQLRFMLK